jgi:uncharacterized SAM-binding protein YcdF (DUF218 family)
MLSRRVLLENGLDAGDVIIVTDGFHQFRARHIAAGLGMAAHSVSSRAPFGLVVFFWAREIPGIILQVWLNL